MTMLCPNSFYNLVCYKGTTLYYIYFFFIGKFQTDAVKSWVEELEKIRSQPSNADIFSSPRLRTLNTSKSKESCTVHPFSVDHKETKS